VRHPSEQTNERRTHGSALSSPAFAFASPASDEDAPMFTRRRAALPREVKGEELLPAFIRSAAQRNLYFDLVVFIDEY
ncbi:hypothetical protein ACQ7B2_17565, partial [Escherichia coli]